MTLFKCQMYLARTALIGDTFQIELEFRNGIKQHRRKVLLSSFHLNGHTLGFHLQTQKLESPCTA